MPSESESPPELCVVIPVYNEEACIESVLENWHAAVGKVVKNFRFLVIDDGSTDPTPSLLAKTIARLPSIEIHTKPNSGHGRSCRFGYEQAILVGCEWMLQIDSDGQCNPGHFTEFWKEKETFDYVIGQRKQRDDGWIRRLISLGCTVAVSLVTRLNCGDANVPYRLIRSRVLAQALEKIPPEFDLQNIALTVALRKNRTLKVKNIPIRFQVRQGGRETLKLRGAIRKGWRMLVALRKMSQN